MQCHTFSRVALPVPCSYVALPLERFFFSAAAVAAVAECSSASIRYSPCAWDWGRTKSHLRKIIKYGFVCSKQQPWVFFPLKPPLFPSERSNSLIRKANINNINPPNTYLLCVSTYIFRQRLAAPQRVVHRPINNDSGWWAGGGLSIVVVTLTKTGGWLGG